jgi:NAD(P)-dependent dehydrogenase (short-subunit alcohol dehydrogenase family)
MGGTRLAGKVAVVSGGAGGLGAGIVRCFVEEGCKVVIADLERQKALAQELIEELPQDYAVLAPLDVTKLDQWEAVVANAVKTFGSLDILV